MLADLTLAELVTASPSAARVLERHHLDFCCGGGETVAEACHLAGLDLDALVAELDAADPVAGPDWASMEMIELVDHIESMHHAYLHAELPALSALAAKVASVHGERHPLLHEVAEAFEELRADLEPHLMKEERVLFPLIRELAAAEQVPEHHGGALADPIRVMSSDHDAAGDLLAWLRVLTDDYVVPADGCASYRSLFERLAELETDTHLHVHKENNVLFPAVLAREAELGRR